MVDGCGASYTVERWLESAGRRCVYPEVICSTLLPEYRGLTPISSICPLLCYGGLDGWLLRGK
jgi:hypothetical protein